MSEVLGLPGDLSRKALTGNCQADSLTHFLYGRVPGAGLNVTIWELLSEGNVAERALIAFGGSFIGLAITKDLVQTTLGLTPKDFCGWKNRSFDLLQPDIRSAVTAKVPLTPQSYSVWSLCHGLPQAEAVSCNWIYIAVKDGEGNLHYVPISLRK